MKIVVVSKDYKATLLDFNNADLVLAYSNRNNFVTLKNRWGVDGELIANKNLGSIIRKYIRNHENT